MRGLLFGFRLFPLFSCGLAFLWMTAACKSTNHPSRTESLSEDADEAATQMQSVVRFRGLFHQIASAQGFKREEIDQMIFLPSPEQLTTPSEALMAATPAAVNEALAQHLRPFSSSSLYKNGKDAPLPPAVDLEKIFKDKGPVTFVVIPGIFGEFLNTGPEAFPFSGVYGEKGRFRRDWQKSLRGIKASAYDLTSLATVEADLSERVQLGSIDFSDSSLGSKVQVVYLNAVWGSLESLGSIEDIAQLNLERLEKALNMIPSDQLRNVYLIGYSRGAPVALEMAYQALARPKDFPSLRGLKGIVSLAGVVHGTALADDAFDHPDAPTYKVLKSLKTTLDGIKVYEKGDGYISASNKVLKNGLEIFQFALDTADVKDKFTIPAGLLAENIKVETADPFFVVGYAFQAFQSVFAAPSTTVLNRLNNIKRAQMLLSKMLEGAEQLRTGARSAWWAAHILPPQLEVYALAGSMPEVTVNGVQSVLLSSPYYGSKTLDYAATLRKSAYALYELSGVSQNDSQVIESQVRFWPRLMPLFNPQQPPLNFYHMGVVGTHHWGLAFPVAIKSKGGEVNPFPREMLLETMGAFVLGDKH